MSTLIDVILGIGGVILLIACFMSGGGDHSGGAQGED